MTEPQVTIDLRRLNDANKPTKESRSNNDTYNASANQLADSLQGPGAKWKKLTAVKEKIKKLHRQVKWIKLVDVVTVGSSVTIQEVGTFRIERLTLGVDTRATTVDRSRLFQHHKTKAGTQTPAEWKSIIRSVLFTPDGGESMEILDYCAFSVHGFLHNHLDGLRDASIAFKLGRLTLPYDCLVTVGEKLKDLCGGQDKPDLPKAPTIAINDVKMDDTDDSFIDAVSDSREFVTSILRGIQEFQLAVSFLGLSKQVKFAHDTDSPVYFNLAMKEVGLDLLRLDPRSPAHRMYFSPKDVAHQALLTAISISAGVDDGHDHPERVLYVPMITATVKTTLPSKAVHFSGDGSAFERNNNILFANLVCTSPSLDLDPKHLPLLLAMVKPEDGPQLAAKPKSINARSLVARLLPKANIKIAVQEPVIRVSLPPLNPSFANDTDYDLLISSTSTITLDIEAKHSTDAYVLAINYRQTSHSLYYQANNGDKHDLMQTDTVEVKVDVNALPEMTVHTSARFQSFYVFLVQPEISEGIRQIIKALRKDKSPPSKGVTAKKPSFLRQIPAWLQHVNVQGSDFNFELAGIDTKVSKHPRGFALQLDSWSAEYKAHREDQFDRARARRSRSLSRSISRERDERSATPLESKKKHSHPTDGRRLAIHVQGLEGLIIDSIDGSSADPFVALPKFEVAFSTSTDPQGPLFHINSHAKSLQIQYSLYNHFAIGVAFLTFRRMFVVPPPVHNEEREKQQANTAAPDLPPPEKADPVLNEITTLDFKASLVQIKAQMPADPPLMLQLFGLDAGRHRWASPFARCKTARLYAGAPRMLSVWSRIVSVKSARLDFREMRHKHGKTIVQEKSIDIATDAIRLGVAHGLVLHAVLDNVINVIKTVEQLHHHFQTNSTEYILTKHPEPPKKMPKISLRTQILLFEIEDSPFEWKLGTIYRAGIIEQQQRLARAEAFRLKVKKMETPGQRRGSSRLRATSAQPPSRSRSHSRPGTTSAARSKSLHPHTSRGSRDDSHRGRGREMRYDAEGRCEMSDSSHLSIEKAHEKLQRFNAESWKKRIDRALYQQTSAFKGLRGLLWGIDDLPEESEQQESILAIPQRPALMSAVISDLAITIDKPSFPLDQLPQFLHDIGKGMPLDKEYGLLLPMNLRVTMGEARCQLRDYPLPLLHVPPVRSGHHPRLPSLSLTTDFVIAEEFQGIESQRHVNVVVVPEHRLGKDDVAKRFAIDVRRTISAVKTYSDMKVEINTSAPTRITWGTSYQPAIQDMMQVIENFTKPPMDPSERVGFWDKIRLSFHSRIDVAWKGDGDVHLNLKGSRDPYTVTGNGAGFVMVWRNQVRFQIAQDPDPRKFMTVDSGDYLLAIPDFNHYARHPDGDDEELDSPGASTIASGRSSAAFKKVVMKLSGNVRWLAGLMFERDLDNGKRTFDFCPHYEVVLRHPDYAKARRGQTYDAFRDFRSHHIHMSIAVAAPHDRDWNVNNLQPSSNYNSVHLSPRFFTHFYDWWSLFSGVMSLPIRQGSLWATVDKSSKKFGRHLGTIKFNLLFSPLFISHIYKHKDAEDYQSDVVSATGLKMKLDSFMLDLHQRRETFEIPGHGDAKPKRTSQMKINESQLDFISADIRAVSATIMGTGSKDIDEADDDVLASYQSPLTSNVDMSKFTIPDNNFTWIDMDDFVELDWILPAEANPKTKILPLTYLPRFTYFRQTDHGDSVSGDTTRSSSFGDEQTHFCVMSGKNDPRMVQAELIQSRIKRIEEQIANNEQAVTDQEFECIRNISGNAPEERLQALRNHTEALQKKHAFLDEMLRTLLSRMEHDDPTLVPTLETADNFPDASNGQGPTYNYAGMDSNPLADYTSDFNNRFVMHNPQIKWNNSLRNIILRYIHQVSQRRGFVYYMSRRAVKFILDILEEQQKTPASEAKKSTSDDDEPTTPLSPGFENDSEIQERIEELLRDGKQFVNADDPERRHSTASSKASNIKKDISTEYLAQNTFHFRLIAPQIQLQSEKNPKSVILIAAKGMQLKVLQIMDKNRMMDEVSGLVQRRFSAAMDSLQIFVTSTKTFSTEYLHMYSGNHYGGRAGEYWPPWVPLEVMFEFLNNPYGFSRVVHRTSASLRYDKFNNLRLKYNDDFSSGEGNRKRPDTAENRMDHIWIEFPHFRAICDSNQYYAMYIIALDLLLYSEPLEKTRSERLEKIMLASDFSDLRGAPEMVEMLQDRIRQLENIKMHFQINEAFLDRQGWKDRIAVDQDLASCEDELFFMMKAITTSQRRVEDRSQQDSSGGGGILRWLISSKEIAWHLIREKDESLVEFQLKDAQFDRTDNNDGSNYNCVEIARINGFNLLPNAVYPEIIAPYIDPARGLHKQQNMQMLRVQWLQLEPIAGIPVVDYFEVNVRPLRVQLEREVAKKLFEYIFPGVGGSAFEGNGFSPFMVKNIAAPKAQGEQDGDDDKSIDTVSLVPTDEVQRVESQQGVGTGAGDLEHRLHPTMKLPDKKDVKPKKQGFGASHTNLRDWNPFQHVNRSQASFARKPNGNSETSPTASTMQSRRGSNRSLVPSNDSGSVAEDKRRPTTSSGRRKDKDKDQPSDDLTEMMSRASNFMTLAFFKIPSTVLCLSYKGRGQRNLEDVHNLVFRLPTFEYRNKTWSNLDLALQIKKDMIKALISHTGAIIGNKFSHHRPSRQQAQSRLKEIANMSTLLSLNNNNNNNNYERERSMSADKNSEVTSNGSLREDSSLYEDRARPSFQSGRPSTFDFSIDESTSSSILSKSKSHSSSLTPGATPMMEGEDHPDIIASALSSPRRREGDCQDENRPATHAGDIGVHFPSSVAAPVQATAMSNAERDVSLFFLLYLPYERSQTLVKNKPLTDSPNSNVTAATQSATASPPWAIAFAPAAKDCPLMTALCPPRRLCPLLHPPLRLRKMVRI